MQHNFKQTSIAIARGQFPHFVTGKVTFGRANVDDSQFGIISGKYDGGVEFFLLSPVEHFGGTVAPAQTKGQVDHVRAQIRRSGGEENGNQEKAELHGLEQTRQRGGMQAGAYRLRKSGSMLVEIAVAISLLVFLAMFLLRGNLTTLEAGNWTITQNMTDAYMTYEKAYAEQVPFEDFLGGSSDWPLYPLNAEQVVEVGKFPGGNAYSATVVRTRIPDSKNLVADGGVADDFTNPSGMEIWRLKSVLIYQVNGQDYKKVRTVVRAR